MGVLEYSQEMSRRLIVFFACAIVEIRDVVAVIISVIEAYTRILRVVESQLGKVCGELRKQRLTDEVFHNPSASYAGAFVAFLIGGACGVKTDSSAVLDCLEDG